jgi:phospholipid/cholesterol/gamma-HCH transport system substrate-binding protein
MKGDDMVKNILVLTSTAKQVMEKINKGQGLLGKLITDEALSKTFANDARQMITSVKSITEKVDRGEGTLGMLVNDTETAEEILDNFQNFSRSLNDIGKSLDEGKTLAARIMKDEEKGTQIFNDLSETAGSLKKFTAHMDSESLAGRLTSDPEYADNVLGNVDTITDSLAVITSKIAHGEGTIGKLVHDESVYQGMSDIVEGINNSRMTRWVLRKSQAKGQKQRQRKEKVPKGPEE